MQVGRPDVNGTVRAFTFAGCKIGSWELEVNPGDDQPVEITLDVVGKSETTATALAAASYTSSNAIFTWAHAGLTIAGSTAQCRGFSLKGEAPMKTDRYALGQTTIDQPIENALRTYSGTVKLDFESLTQYARFTAASEFAMVFSLTRSTDSIVVTMNCRADGAPPALSGHDLLGIEVPFKCIGTTTDATGITAVVTSSEATP